MDGISRLDRRLGALVRSATASVPHGPRVAATVASSMSPAFRLVVALMIADRRRRTAGLRALAAGVAAALAARSLRDRLARPRPGPRVEAAFPSRHAAAGAAIAVAVAGPEPRLGRALAGAVAVGALARVATAEHEPGDVLAGGALGLIVGRAMRVL
jgi:membrane-associated phospholipid phosphatase